MREVTFGMIWQCYGRQTVEIPDDIVVNDDDDIRGYLESIWKSIPLPDGDYVEDSDTIDEVVGFMVRGEVDEPQCYIEDGEGFPAAVNRNVKVEWTDIGEGRCRKTSVCSASMCQSCATVTGKKSAMPATAH